MALETSLEVWRAVVRSGLQEVRANDLPGYDAALVQVLRGRLYPNARGSLEHELSAAPPPVEDFLDAFFAALKPFSEMLRDVLGMFEVAGARRSDENLRIAFDFDKATKPLALTLREFREVEAFFRQIVRPVVVRQWNSNLLFSLTKDVRDVVNALGPPNGSALKPHLRNVAVREWVEDNGRPTWLTFPGFPRSGDAELDPTVTAAESLIDLMIGELRKLGSTYGEFSERIVDLRRQEDGKAEESGISDDLPRWSFVGAAHDFWPNNFAETVCLAIEAVGEHGGRERQTLAAQFAAAIRTGFDRPPRSERTIVSLEEDFRDLVNLPIWKKRHELYAVWVASRIADALDDLSFEWHPDGDTLRFPFGGAELATLRDGEGGMHAFWTEKKTALKGAGVFGRKHIQPDYRIMTVPTHRHDSTSLVVECKQYRKWSRKNFGAALDDYAKGCPVAPVILVNYGPTDPSILTMVGASRRDRTFLVGDFKPGESVALDRFRDLVRRVYPAPRTFTAAGTQIELRWGPMFRDLDLHLIVREMPTGMQHHIGFGTGHGALTEPPWVELSEDIRESPPGFEQLVISRWLDAEYDVLVHDYSGEGPFPVGDVSVRLVFAPSGEEHSFSSTGGRERWWHVCRIHGASGRVEVIDHVYSTCPYVF